MDLLSIGTYIPCRGSVPLWDLDMYAPTVSRGNLNKKTISVLSKESSIVEKDRNITTNLAEERSIGNDLDVKSDDVRSGNRIINIDSDNDIDVGNNILANSRSQNQK